MLKELGLLSDPSSFCVLTGQELHLAISMVTDIVSDMVSGKELTKVADFLSQTGGTILSGMVNDYLTTGKVDFKNIGLDALGGTIKGTFGTAFTEWGKKLLKTDSRVVKKIAGTLLGVTFGTGVDLGTDLVAGREINLLQTFQQNLVQSGLGQMFGESIDASSGAFLITATDFTLMDVYGPVKQYTHTPRACLKNHSRHLHNDAYASYSSLCAIFAPNSGYIRHCSLCLCLLCALHLAQISHKL